jgi:putative ABC transport system permease protein
VNELFGVSMNLIMYVLLGLLAFSIVTVLVVALRNQIMFKMGLRNIPRRRAQTILIVIGLMLSTMIISAAFTTGDTVDRSVTSEVYNLLGSLDEVIQLREGDEDSTFDDPTQAIVRDETFSQTAALPIVDSLAANPMVDAAVPSYSDVAVAVNLEERLSAPLFNVLGLDPNRSRDLPDIRDIDSGRELRVIDLAAGEIYVNESAAEELNVDAGDSIILITRGKETPFRVKAVVEDRRLAGSAGISVRRQGGVVPLETAQALFEAPGRLTQIFVSNQGDERGGLVHADAMEDQIEAMLAAQPVSDDLPRLSVVPAKRTGVDIAELAANIFTTFFLVLGLFSIGAGILLIFMIFVMLAAERKPEMGMARAVGTKRADLVQIFLSEGMAYNLAAAAVGTAMGVLVAFIMTVLLARVLSELEITIAPHVTFRSLAISYSLGVVLTFFTVTFSSWRVSVINIVRAIRDIPEPPTPKPMWHSRGFFSTLLGLIFKPGSLKAWGGRVAIFLVGFSLQGAGAAAGSAAVQILLSAAGVLLLILVVFLTFRMGFLFVILSLPLVLMGMSEDNSFFLLFGLSLLPLGVAMILRSFGFNERLTYTAAGLFMIYVWEIDFSVGLLERIFGETTGDIEMFFLSGVMVTIAATFLVVYNSDLILRSRNVLVRVAGLGLAVLGGIVAVALDTEAGAAILILGILWTLVVNLDLLAYPLKRAGFRLNAMSSSIKMAVAYPLASKMRTGMTMAMFCLVVFALVVISSMNHNFNRLYLSDRSLGGWDVYVDENPTNPIGDLRTELTRAGSPAVSQIDTVGVGSRMRDVAICQPLLNRDCDDATAAPTVFNDWDVQGNDAGFINATEIPFQTRARGYADNKAVWQALARDPSLAVIDSFAMTGDFDEPVLSGVEPGDREMEPIRIVLRDRASGRTAEVSVIAIMEEGASQNYFGLHISQSAFESIIGEADSRRHYIRTVEGANDREVAREIESALLTQGAQSESLRYEADRLAATQNGFFYLMQGFMGLGLFVGVAAVGVIAFRTVVERRQQIGMLRAIGYTKGMIGLTFLIESAFIAFMGVLSGVFFALILARQLVTEEFANSGINSFSVPWQQVFIISGLAFGSALLMTLIPSRQASAMPIAEALRYE